MILAPMQNTEAVTLLVLAKVGSRYETKELNGISHFLEHLFFKGTKSRPNPGDIHKELDKIGAIHNAFTTKEATGFWIKSSAKDFDVGLDIVSDILLEPIFKREEIEKERGVILQEISMYEDDPRRKVVEVLENVVFGDQPIGWDIAGKKENVLGIKRDDIVKYESENYLSENMVVVLAGSIDKEKMFKNLSASFGKIKKGKNKPPLGAEILQDSPLIKIINKDSDQTHISLAARAYDMFDEKRYASGLLSVILGGNMSSRLSSEIREKLGLAYYVYAYDDQYLDCGYLGMGAGIPHGKIEEVFKKIKNIISGIKEKEISKSDLDDAKGFIRGQTALRFESSDAIAGFAAEQELFYGKIMQPEEILEKIEKVSQNDILNIAREIFRPDKINMAVIGKHDNPDKKEEILKEIFKED